MPNNNWTALWGNAVSIAEHHPESYAKNITLRYPVYAAFGGSALRLTFDNFCGEEPVTITRATVGVLSGGGVVPSTLRPLRFSGSESLTLPAGGRAQSDPLDFAVSAGSTLAVSFYLGDFTLMASAVYVSGPLSQSQFSIGDATGAAVLPRDLTKNNSRVYFLSDVEVLPLPGSPARALVCYGDSITAQDWPDYLALRAKQLGRPTAVIRKAASGTRVLRQYRCIQYDSYGLKGSIRFPHELPVAGADTVIIQQGINDIIHPVGVEANPFRPWSDLPTADQLIAGLDSYLAQAHALGLKAWLGTLLPIAGWRTYAPFREELRCAVNEWMRTTPNAEGCIDFDAALRDPARPEAFLPQYDSGDHLHPSRQGYQAMAAAVPESLL